ncbi:MAG: PAC2 family protein [Nitrosopumilus sp.]|uniref:PAC2 family protein n=1 Tax=Nitrosopumilus sp. TaxID=2024843 RepID=UPI0024728382|nr:PAC2 family protein [Nitrosopumilus sp.]MDH5431236.1 PAC2 family protein [Nitrosopumilus sp.]
MSLKDTQNEKLLIVAFPSVGLVGAFAISYLITQLQMKDIGELEIGKISPSYMIENGNIYGPIRIYNKDNIYAILANIPLSPLSTYELINKSIEFAKSNNIEKIIIPRGLEVGKDFKENPISYGLVANQNSKRLLDEYSLPIIPGATVLGADASVISALKNSETSCIVLYTTCRMMLPDDDAIIKSIKTLSDIIKVKVETEKFEERLEKISKDNQKMIEETRKYYEDASGTPASIQPAGIG